MNILISLSGLLPTTVWHMIKISKLLEHIDACWLRPEEFTKLNWTEADAALIKQLWK